MSTKLWKHINADKYTSHRYDDVKEQIIADGFDASNINNNESYLWSKVNGVWYPMVQIAEDVDVIERADTMFNAMPDAVFDSMNRVWESEKDSMSGSILWECKVEGIPSVYATPYFDGMDCIPVAIIDDNGDCVRSFNETIDIDVMLSLSNALGKIEKTKVDVSKELKQMFDAMAVISEKWNEAGIDELDGYPLNESFDDMMLGLMRFFEPMTIKIN